MTRDLAYEAVVFDNDGVLTHPTDAALLREATAAALAAVGVSDPSPGDVEALDNDPDAVEELAPTYGFDPDEFWSHHEQEKVAVQRAALRDGRKPLYDDVDALGSIPTSLGVVSNNQHATVENILAIDGLEDLFETHYGRDPTIEGYRRGKPDPHYLERALDDLGTCEVLYVGDSWVDVAAADRAGVDAAFIRRSHSEGEEFPVQPEYRIDGLADLAALVADGTLSST